MSEQPTYHNALSDRLVVCYFPTQSVFTVYNKDHLAKWQYTAADHTFPNEFADAIFSETHVLRMLPKATLAPLGESDYAPYFKINFGEGYIIGALESELFTIVYENTPIPYNHKLVSAHEKVDLDVFYRYANQKNYRNALYFYHIQNEVSILAWKDGKFVLANRYAADNADELFYYVMLVVEQLELPVPDMHFALAGSKEQHIAYHKLFEKYLAPLHLTNKAEDSEANEVVQLANFLSKCVL